MNKKCYACETQQGKILLSTVDNNYYCKKHYMQMWRYGYIKNYITQNDPNEWKDNICICRGINGEITGEMIVDHTKKNDLLQYKIYLRKDGYPATKIKGETVLIHKILTNTVGSGKTTLKTVVDHINGNRADNRLENLRIISQSENVCNKHNQLIAGVSFHSNRRNSLCWRSYTRRGNQVIVDWFKTKKEAIKHRLQSEIKLYGKIINSNNKKYEKLLNHSSTKDEV